MRVLSVVNQRSRVPVRSTTKATVSNIFSPSASPRQERLYINTLPEDPTEVRRIGWNPVLSSSTVVFNDRVTLAKMKCCHRRYADHKGRVELSRRAPEVASFSFIAGLQTPPRYRGAQPGQKRKVDVFDAYGLGNRKDLSPTPCRLFRSRLCRAKEAYYKAYMEEVCAGKTWKKECKVMGKKRQTANHDVSDKMDGVEHTGLPALQCPCRHCMDWRKTTWEDTYLPPQEEQIAQRNSMGAQPSAAPSPTRASNSSARGVKRSAEDPDQEVSADEGKKLKLASLNKMFQTPMSTPTMSSRKSGHSSSSSRAGRGAFQDVRNSKWTAQASASSLTAATSQAQRHQNTAVRRLSTSVSSAGNQAQPSLSPIVASPVVQSVEMPIMAKPSRVATPSRPVPSAPLTPPRSSAPSPEIKSIQVPTINISLGVHAQIPPLTPPQDLEELAIAFQARAAISDGRTGSSATSSAQTAQTFTRPELQTKKATSSVGDVVQTATSTQTYATSPPAWEDHSLEELSADMNAVELAEVEHDDIEEIFTSQPATTSSTTQVGTAHVPDVVDNTPEECFLPEPAASEEAAHPTSWSLRKCRFYARQLLDNSKIFSRFPSQIQALISRTIQVVLEKGVNYDHPDCMYEEIDVEGIDHGVGLGGLWNIRDLLETILDGRGDRTTKTDFLTRLESVVEQHNEQFLLPFARALLHRGVKPVDLMVEGEVVSREVFSERKWMVDNVGLDEAYWSSSKGGIQATAGLPDADRLLIEHMVKEFQRIGRISDVQKVMFSFFTHAAITRVDGAAVAMFQGEILRKSGYRPEDEHTGFQNLWNDYEDCITDFYKVECVDGSLDYPDDGTATRASEAVHAFDRIFHYRYPRSFQNGNSVEKEYPIDLTDPKESAGEIVCYIEHADDDASGYEYDEEEQMCEGGGL